MNGEVIENSLSFKEVDSVTKNIKKYSKTSTRGRKSKDFLDFQNYLKKDSIIEKLECYKEEYRKKCIEKEEIIKPSLQFKSVLSEKAKGLEESIDYIIFIKVKTNILDEMYYKKLLELIDNDLNLNIPFSILVINYCNTFKKRSEASSFISDIKNIEKVFEYILECSEQNFISFFKLNKITKNEMKKFLLNFYYYYHYLEDFIFL